MSDINSSFTLERRKLTYFGFWLIIPFCSIAIHESLPVPPTLILFIIGSIILLVSTKIRILKIVDLPLICVAYFLISQILIQAPFSRYMGVILAILYFVVTISFGFNLSNNERRTLIDQLFMYSIIMLLIECIWRYTHPSTDFSHFEGTGDVRWIYQYKMEGLMYSDSNVVGFHVMVLFFFLLYDQEVNGVKRNKTKILLLVLLFLSISRAAWIGTAIGWIYVKFLRRKKLDFYIANLIFFSLFSIVIYIFLLQERIQSDLSFQSKLEIIDIVINYFSHATLPELTFGIGFSNTLERLGIYAHNFFMVFLIESGWIGLILMILFFLQLVIITKRKALFILIPFCISTLSNTVTFMPYFYVIMGLIYIDQHERVMESN